MKKRVLASARVVVTVEVLHCGTWGDDCKLDQVFRQAADSAVGYIRQQTAKDGRLRIVGEPKVTAIFSEEER